MAESKISRCLEGHSPLEGQWEGYFLNIPKVIDITPISASSVIHVCLFLFLLPPSLPSPILCFVTESFYIALVILELTVLIRLGLPPTDIHLPLPLSPGVKGVYHALLPLLKVTNLINLTSFSWYFFSKSCSQFLRLEILQVFQRKV